MAPTDASGSLILVSWGRVRYEVVAAACWDAVRDGGVPLCIRCCGDFFGVLGLGHGAGSGLGSFSCRGF